MKTKFRAPGTLLCLTCLLAFAAPTQAQNKSQPAVPVALTVTVMKAHPGPEPVLQKEDLVVLQGSKRLPVSSWVPAQGKDAGLQLVILLDDTTRANLATQIEELRAFIRQQPPTTAVEIGYMHDGTVEMSQGPPDTALRPPAGREGSTYPYASLAEVCDHWSFDPAYPRREVLLISDGVISNGQPHERQGSRGGGTNVIGDPNPNVTGISMRLQADGIQVFAISARDLGANPGRPDPELYGNSALQTITGISGGEALQLGYNLAPSFAPFLEQFQQRLAQQYLLTFLAPQKKDAGFQKVKLSTEVVNAKLESAEQVWVPAPPAPPR